MARVDRSVETMQTMTYLNSLCGKKRTIHHGRSRELACKRPSRHKRFSILTRDRGKASKDEKADTGSGSQLPSKLPVFRGMVGWTTMPLNA